MAQPIRILHIVNTMNIIGGYEAFIMNIYRCIDREKVQFDFLTHGGVKGTYDDEILSLGGRIYAMPAIKTNTRTYYWRYFAYKRALREFFAEHHEHHIIHGHMTNTASIYIPIAKKYGDVSHFIMHSHQSAPTPGLSGVVSRILQRSLPKLATECFACSDIAARWLFPQSYIDEGKVRIIKNGVDPSRFVYDEKKRQTLRRELGLENNFVIGNVGRFKTEKNHTFQIDMFKELLDERPDAVLMLIGDGELKHEIERKAERVGIKDSVMFMGMRADVCDLLQTMDVFILPSLHEGLPVIGVEAQTSGLPCVFSDGVTQEADITGNVSYIPLDVGAREWARGVVAAAQGFVRRDCRELIAKAGYDINETAAFMQEYYISIIKRDYIDIT